MERGFYEIGDFFYSYTEGTFQYDLNCFFLHNTIGVDRDSIWRWYECIPVFKSEAERKSFVSFLKEEGVRKPKRKIFSVPNKLDNGGKTEMYKKRNCSEPPAYCRTISAFPAKAAVRVW